MCTAITFQSKDHYFGRNLDLEFSYQEAVTITPRNFPFSFRCTETMHNHYALIGMATVVDDYPLYYDATNEMGLSMAGLNFPGNAVYLPEYQNVDNITPFEFIPWILGQCKDIPHVKKLLARINLLNVPFSKQFPLSPLHWIISDENSSITVEPMANGLHIYENPVGVLTNNPPFEYHLYHLAEYMNVTSEEVTNRFAPNISLSAYSRGMGTIGLPGDLSSASRFVKASYTKLNSLRGNTECESLSQFFHILGSVAQQRGCVKVGNQYEFTIYSSCCNTTKGVYYYTTYENSQISAVYMHRENLESDKLISYPLITGQRINEVN